MSNLADISLALTGLVMILVVLSDVFQSIIVPHYRPQGTRLSPLLISKLLWKPIRRVMRRLPKELHLEADLTMFAPAAMMSLLTCWLMLVTVGYALILWAERHQIKPPLPDMESALYFAATSVLTIGYGDVIACAPLGRITVICAALTGLVLLAITVSYMFAIQSHFHAREVAAQMISSRHGHSGNGAVFYRSLKTDGNATSSLEISERWVTEIYQSHSAYPLLLYFRSRSPKASWLLQLNVLLDAVAIALALDEKQHRAILKSIYQNGCRSVETFTNYLNLKHKSVEAHQDPAVFEQLFTSLGAADPLKAASKFTHLRQRYYPALFVLSDFFLIYLPPLSVVSGARISLEPEAIASQLEEIAFIEAPRLDTVTLDRPVL